MGKKQKLKQKAKNKNKTKQKQKEIGSKASRLQLNKKLRLAFG